MTPVERISVLTPLDILALVTVFVAWAWMGWWIEHTKGKRKSVTVRMADYRRAWMVQMITREPRIFDATILGGLRQSTSFFASTCIFALGGVLALIGNSERLLGVAQDLTLGAASVVVWQAKLLVIAVFLTHAFLKFVWANRVFSYCAVVMAAVPNEVDDPKSLPMAGQAAELNIRAAWNFNRGLRSVYFAIGSLAWLLGAWALLLATAVVIYTLWEREFASHAHKILSSEPKV